MSAAMIEDLKDKRVPPSLYWSVEQVTQWVEELGLGQYKVRYISPQTEPLLPGGGGGKIKRVIFTLQSTCYSRLNCE